MSPRLLCLKIVVMINNNFIASIFFPMVVRHLKYTHDCIPCNGTHINAFPRNHFISKEIMVDLLVNIKEEVVLEVLITYLKWLCFNSVNLCMRVQLNIVLPTILAIGYWVHRLFRELEHFLRRTGALLPLVQGFVLTNILLILAIKRLDCYIINVS